MAQSKDELRAKQRAYAKANRAKRTLYMREYRQRRKPDYRTFIFDQLGRKCAHCGLTDERVLTVDHRHGGGAAHRKGRATAAYYADIGNNLDDYRILCFNCNWIAHKYPDDQVATVS